ncbi:MAG: N4-gp56 family major capsid protein [Angelakisella sp.]
MADVITKLAQMIDPEVMGDMISGKISKKIVVAPFAKVDTSLQGVPGDTITVPSYGYIGDAADVAEGVSVTIEAMSTTSKQTTIKKAMKGVSLTDEAVLSGYGNPVGEANSQLAKSIAAKLDNDTMDALQTATLAYDGSAAQIAYNGIIDAIDLFEEETNTEKVMFIHPKQVTVLRKDSKFLSADKYQAGLMVSGEIGMIANTRIVPSKKVPLVKVGASGSQVDCYACPIVKLEQDAETEDETPAMTIYLKRDTNVETERISKNRTTEITADKFYAVALSNESKVVLAKFKK